MEESKKQNVKSNAYFMTEGKFISLILMSTN